MTKDNHIIIKLSFWKIAGDEACYKPGMGSVWSVPLNSLHRVWGYGGSQCRTSEFTSGKFVGISKHSVSKGSGACAWHPGPKGFELRLAAIKTASSMLGFRLRTLIFSFFLSLSLPLGYYFTF